MGTTTLRLLTSGDEPSHVDIHGWRYGPRRLRASDDDVDSHSAKRSRPIVTEAVCPFDGRSSIVRLHNHTSGHTDCWVRLGYLKKVQLVARIIIFAHCFWEAQHWRPSPRKIFPEVSRNWMGWQIGTEYRHQRPWTTLNGHCDLCSTKHFWSPLG